MSKPRAPQTIAAANGIAADEEFGAVAPPIYLTTSFAFASFGQPQGHEYTRTSNPSRDLLADTIARLEGGVGAVVLASGMAAIDLVLSLLKPDEHVVARTIAMEGRIDSSAPGETEVSSVYPLSIKATKRHCWRRSRRGPR